MRTGCERLAMLQAQRANHRNRPSIEERVGFVTMELEQVEPQLLVAIEDELARRIDEHADDLMRVGNYLANLARAIERYRARTGRVKVQPDHVGAKVDRIEGVLGARDSADFDFDVH